MTNPILFKRDQAPFEAYGDGPGTATIARLIGPDISTTIGAGLATFDSTSIAWTVLYDEVVVGIEGAFRLRTGDTVHEVGPGDVLWIPKGTALRYEGSAALVFYALYPVDWRTRGDSRREHSA
ncbi:AraC family ligand binding domain-containing protein [Azospirillum canadense]|uniref:AraC family ligand binding domain-containing protein n=1 Tax=Azospirillum canadense TaxID=403962 RepID=UPI00222794D5|nr:AraC family ligand binding domain-containing protein [Azospirillum canadense]MCW2241592.1 ethanolamine utilization protein EutQ [Azospirillum canadense]